MHSDTGEYIMETIEILLATYNGAEYLSEQIDSILGQDTDAWHLTISDDGSSDDTAQIIDDYTRKHSRKISRVFSGTHFGNARDHFFWLMRQCDADFMLFCDQDDVWHPDKVSLFAQALHEETRLHGCETPLLVFSDLKVVDQQLNCLYPSLARMQRQSPNIQDFRYLLFQNTVTGCAMGINHSLAEMAGRCEDTSRIVMHDWWLALVAARFGKMIYLDESTVDYRQHGKNCVGAKNVKSISYICQKLFHLEYYQQHIMEKKMQATMFRRTYTSELTFSEREMLDCYSELHCTISFKLRYMRWIRTLAGRLGFFVKW